MIPIFIVTATFVICFLAASRSLKAGLCAVIAVGYLYGIIRANVPGTLTYLLFDIAAIALYLPQLWRPMSLEQRIGSRELRIWVSLLIGWPVLLFVAFPTNSPFVEAVGLRANAFLIPFMILGTRITSDDLHDITYFVAALNVGAVAVGTAEYFLGIARFFPLNEVTEIIYRSHDLLERTAFRIPATFSSAHAFAGTMAVTLPLLIGSWANVRKGRQTWHEWLLTLSIVASFLGIFMAAARLHTVTAGVIALVVTFSGRLSGRQWLRWVVAVAIIGYVVAGNVRLQRFTTLSDRSGVRERIGGSVNEDFFTVVTAHPLGRGLAGGGTSVPYFLESELPRDYGAVLENEYARIALEQGLPGLMLWIAFIAWVLVNGSGPIRDELGLTRRLVWVVSASNFTSGLLGMGMLVSVPQSALMFIAVGWMTTSRRSAATTAVMARTAAARERLAS